MTIYAKKRKKIVVRDNIAIVEGEKYRATVMRVTGWDNDGTPRAFTLLRDDESVNVEGGEHFEVVFARADLQTRRH